MQKNSSFQLVSEPSYEFIAKKNWQLNMWKFSCADIKINPMIFFLFLATKTRAQLLLQDSFYLLSIRNRRWSDQMYFIRLRRILFTTFRQLAYGAYLLPLWQPLKWPLNYQNYVNHQITKSPLRRAIMRQLNHPKEGSCSPAMNFLT